MLDDKSASDALTAFGLAGREALKLLSEEEQDQAENLRYEFQVTLEDAGASFGVGMAALYQFAEDLGAGILVDTGRLKRFH